VDTLVTLFRPATGETGAASAAASERGVRLDGLRVLLVEDNEINQQVAVELMEGVGVAVDVASNGREAVERLEAARGPLPYDVVLMDVQMPEMDGYQATARIRAQERFRALPIVAMTAHATVEEKEKATAAGMVAHISKPIDPALLYEVLARFRPGGPATQPQPAAVAVPPAKEPLPKVDGLDPAEGLRRVAGNQALYERLLRQFLDGHKDAAERVHEELERGDRATAERLAHTVKGVAANLAAGPVQAAAGALEKAIRDGVAPAKLESLRRTLGDALGRLAAALGPVLDARAAEAAPDPRPDAPAAIEPAVLGELVKRWSRLLADCDASSLDGLEAESGALRALFDGTAAYDGFARQVKAYDFESALAELRRAASGKGIEA
jgi:two-component system sensor histidine kinase/response regulator